MTTTYGSFPGVKVEVAGGGITSVAVGEQEKLVIFGEASYQNDGTITSDGDEDPLESTLTGTPETPETINARREANTTFGDGSELADAMQEALANGANTDFLYGVAPRRFNVFHEIKSTQSGNLDKAPIWEEDVSDEANISTLIVTDTSDGELDVEYDYSSPPAQPSAADTIAVNPLTGEFAADAAPTGDYEIDYKYLDWQSAIDASAVTNVVEEDETAIYDLISDSDTVSSGADGTVSNHRDNYKLINVVSGALPNDNEVITSDDQSLASDHSNYTRRDAQFDSTTFTQGSVDSDYYFKFAPVREENSAKTVLGGVGGLFAGNALSDPIYNDTLEGYDELEQSFTKTDADNMRSENVIPIRQAGSIRVKDNLSTSSSTDWERDFWRRRIADRVILIGKTIGDTIIGRINDEQTREAAARLIRAEIREFVDDRLLQPNTGSDTRWYVDVYPSATNANEVKIDIGFTPFGIVKRIDESITINT